MAERILSVDPNFTLLMAHSAYQAYSLIPPAPPTPAPVIDPPNGYRIAAQWKGKNPGIFEDTVEPYGIVFQNEKDAGEVIFSFRGTVTTADMEADAFIRSELFQPFKNSTPYHVHVSEGFNAIYTNPVPSQDNRSMQQELMHILTQLNPTKVYITGHSLGSALAELFTLDLYVSYPKRSFEIRHYNFACPRVGAQSFANLYLESERNQPDANKTVRIVNYEDYIPCLPPEAFDFHHGPAYFLVYFYAINYPESPTERHSLYNYWHVLQTVVHKSPQVYNGIITGLNGTPLQSKDPGPTETECPSWFTDKSKDEKPNTETTPKKEDLSSRKGCLGLFF